MAIIYTTRPSFILGGIDLLSTPIDNVPSNNVTDIPPMPVRRDFGTDRSRTAEAREAGISAMGWAAKTGWLFGRADGQDGIHRPGWLERSELSMDGLTDATGHTCPWRTRNGRRPVWAWRGGPAAPWAKTGCRSAVTGRGAAALRRHGGGGVRSAAGILRPGYPPAARPRHGIPHGRRCVLGRTVRRRSGLWQSSISGSASTSERVSGDLVRVVCRT